jgi:hypothetical protein
VQRGRDSSRLREAEGPFVIIAGSGMLTGGRIVRHLLEGLDDEPAVEVRYRERRYVVPADEVRVLPICNTSTENLAALLGRALRERIARHFEGVQVDALWLAVEETPGQRGVYRFSR